MPLSEETNIGLLEEVIEDQTNILKTVYGSDVDVAKIPQIWTLCEFSLRNTFEMALDAHLPQIKK